MPDVGEISPDGGYRFDGHNWQPLASGEHLDYFADPHGAMHDAVLRSGDYVTISFPHPVIIPELAAPIPLVASGIRDPAGAPVCVQGDELPPAIRHPLAYTAPPFVVPGSGLLSIQLAPDQLGMHQVGGHPVLKQGSTANVVFRVAQPAMEPDEVNGPIPDPLTEKHGTAHFVRNHVGHY